MPAPPTFDPETIAEARRLYDETNVPVEDIAGLLGLKTRTFNTKRAEWGWQSRMVRRSNAALAASAPDAGGEEASSSSSSSSESVPDRAVLIARIRASVDREIAGIERSLRRLDRMAPRAGDAEKAARTLASLVKTLNELKRLDGGGPVPGAEDDDIDIDEFRRDLARRLDALCADGTDG